MPRLFLICLLLWLMTNSGLAQTKAYLDSTTVFRLDSLPAQGVLLDKGWKWQAGDNPKWAKPGFDDSAWEPINPALDIHKLDQVRTAQIGWFRLRLQVSPSVTQQALSVVISQAGASEIFLNGKLIYRFGTVSQDYKQEQTYQLRSQPFSILLNSSKTQVISVRYSFSRQNFYLRYLTSSYPCLQLRVKPTNVATVDNRGYTVDEASLTQLVILMSLFLLLGAFSFFLYFLYRTDQFYLYLGLHCLGQFLQIFLRVIASSQSSMTLVSVLHFVSHLCSVASALAILIGFYTLFRKPKGWLFYVINLYAVTTVPLLLWSYEWGGIYALSFYLFLNFDMLRLAYGGARHQHPGAGLLLVNFILFFVFFIAFVFLSAIGQYEAGSMASIIAIFIIPFGLSLFVAGEFARTGRSLQHRVKEVELLSAQTIAQEKEKQQILTTQNETLERQVSERTAQLNRSLENLKATQTQLIQKEKMASLGELTAGIAHEIQNPLNFVNNFSEVSSELVGELKEKRKKGNQSDESVEDELLNDLEQNLAKITLHGGRASSIVKGMLEHSRTTTGERQPTDLNALCEEYLRLAYHGFRAKDKEFNAELKTNFDPNLGQVEVVPQEIGRVLLNLFNNAFYAVSAKNKLNPKGYQPTVSVSTNSVGNSIAIRVHDNGIGIPDAVVQKIFQPFFTTKPTGQGTGLGLSLSYDIVTKGHGGAMEVTSQEGQGTEFIVRVPALAY